MKADNKNGKSLRIKKGKRLKPGTYEAVMHGLKLVKEGKIKLEFINE